MNLIVRPFAAAELEEAYDWYENQRPGLGEEFIDAVARVFLSIQENPCRYPVIHRETRRAVVRRFPYSILCRLMDDDVNVVACFHGSRDPRR